MTKKLRLLVVGAGGREHAIAKSLAQSSLVEKVFCAPGNVGMASDKIEVVNIGELEFDALKGLVAEEQIDWTFVGPENALVAGIVDSFEADGLKIFGPNKEAARLEGSKDYAMRFMDQYQIPTAKFATYQSSETAIAGLKNFSEPIVIKADGLAAGKGVVIAPSKQEAEAEIRLMFKKGQKQIVLEEFLAGDEYSLFVLIGKSGYRILPMAQDHKRAFDQDKGPNTGGMGAYSPVPQLAKVDYQRMLTEVVEPTIAGLKQANLNYQGVLYIGMILTAQGPKVIEYNVRLGDPETQVVLPRLATDFAELINAFVTGADLPEVKVKPNACLGVVLAAAGYPQAPIKGQAISLQLTDASLDIDYANVTGSLDDLKGAGGRILTVLASAPSLVEAQLKVYECLNSQVQAETFYRKDIGFRATKASF